MEPAAEEIHKTIETHELPDSLALTRALAGALAKGALCEVARLLGDRAVWHVARGALAGDYRGRECVLGLLGKRLLQSPDLRAEPLADTASTLHGVTLRRVSNGERAWIELLVCRAQDGRIAEVWQLDCA